jgi:8-oxo-dGTP pyrophosphatase MutT (NUDIX family)
MTGAIDWRERIVKRLAGSAPSHAADAVRYGGVAPRFNELLRTTFPADGIPAAVLIPIVAHEPEATVLLTVRAPGLRHHAGQIAFPGGRVEAGDSDYAATALRETREEIGLDAGYAEVVGYLPDHLMLTGYRVTPVVAVVRPGFTLQFDAREVADAFEVPLSYIFDPLNHGQRLRRIRDRDIQVYDIPFGGRSIWGATAGMLVNLYEIARGAGT